ncbi:MAG: 50S ribosomal protein L11 methyltransferase [Elusimicrobia bacterium]|nr:50S ribosomal protein L11 methyltransferase [Elusimicrobiota bacterium]
MKKDLRFSFGKNWQQFLKHLDDTRIQRAEKSLCKMLDTTGLEGKNFIDIGCGSGLFSLAAVRLKAKRIHSFDYDIQSVACAQELKNKYFGNDLNPHTNGCSVGVGVNWTVERGSVLDKEYLNSLGQFDVVYSWGVLHHTGSMWQAFENIVPMVKTGGKLFIAIYNDQGKTSRRWKTVKQIYNFLPGIFRIFILIPAFIRIWGPAIIRDFLHARPFHSWRNYKNDSRGMSPWRDVVDWVGGYPFETAKPEKIIQFFEKKGFTLDKIITCGRGYGNNEFVFRK